MAEVTFKLSDIIDDAVTKRCKEAIEKACDENRLNSIADQCIKDEIKNIFAGERRVVRRDSIFGKLDDDFRYIVRQYIAENKKEIMDAAIQEAAKTVAHRLSLRYNEVLLRAIQEDLGVEQ